MRSSRRPLIGHRVVQLDKRGGTTYSQILRTAYEHLYGHCKSREEWSGKLRLEEELPAPDSKSLAPSFLFTTP